MRSNAFASADEDVSAPRAHRRQLSAFLNFSFQLSQFPLFFCRVADPGRGTERLSERLSERLVSRFRTRCAGFRLKDLYSNGQSVCE